jgi:proline dehydrogenase
MERSEQQVFQNHDADSKSPGSPKKLPIPDFNDSKAAYEAKSNFELFRAMVVFQLCRIPFIVRHSEKLLIYSRKMLGGTLSDALLKATLFGHFCAGEDEKRIEPVILKMQKSGVGSILDYAHEDDGSSSQEKCQKKTPAPLDVNTVFQDTNPKVRYVRRLDPC